MSPRSLLTLAEFSQAEVIALLDRADAFREARAVMGAAPGPLTGRSVALVFEKPSTRTRVSFDVAIHELGAHPVYLSSGEIQLARGETVEDTAAVLSRYVQAIVARVNSHATLEALAGAASVPVVNALSDLHHPCQALADFQTLRRRFNGLEGLEVAYIGDGNNVLASLVVAASRLGARVRAASPDGYELDTATLPLAAAEVSQCYARLSNPEEAVAGADCVYTDVWVSMGQDREKDERRRAFAGFGVTPELMDFAKPTAVFMHCLPAHRGEEVEAAVIDGPRSVVFEQAENRLHTAKAVLATLMEV